jgi:hypothetical protein
LLKSECLNHLYLQMLLSSELGLLPQLRKWRRQRCYLACGKILTRGRMSAHYQWQSHWTITTKVKLGVFAILLHFNTLYMSCPLNKFIYSFKIIKLFLKHPV